MPDQAELDTRLDRGTKPPQTGAAVRLRRGITRGFSSLHVRNYRLFIFGQVISVTGTWMQTTAQAWLVLQLTQSPFDVGLISTLQFLPVTIFALFGGVIADRVPKRSAIVVTQSAAMLQALVFGILVATGGIRLWHVYLLALIQGLITAIDNPVRQSFVVEMVGREDLVNAVSLNSMTFNLARIVGPALTGIVIAQIGIAPALFANAISFVPVIGALLMMNPQALFARTFTAARGSVLHQVREGLNYTWRTPAVLTIMIVAGAIGTFGFNFTVIVPLLGGFVLHTDAQNFGALFSFLGLGSVVAAASTAYFSRVTTRRLLASAFAFSLAFAALSLSTNLTLSSILVIPLGFFGIMFA
ncbi:MAG TPA: MFS transporter, partial [Aggregatilineales bacterium]|nr:MFS transporter [Aggregatilineales bacterium]